MTMLCDANSHGDQTQGGDNVFLLDVPDDSSQDVASVTSSVKRLSFSMYYDEANSNPHDMDVFFEDVPTLAQLMQLEEPISLNLLQVSSSIL